MLNEYINKNILYSGLDNYNLSMYNELGGRNMIDKNSPIPVYYQLKEAIKAKISDGTWKVGDCIASERELSETYEVSRMTIRQALGELVQEGILRREKGKGTFVCEPEVKQQDVMSFTEIIKKTGKELKTEVLSMEYIDTPKKIKEVLNFPKLYKINRIRRVSGEVIANEIIYIPKENSGELDSTIVLGSIFKILEERGCYIDHSESEIKAIIMDEYYRNLFEVDMQVPLIKTYGTTLDNENKILFIEESVYRSDKYILEVNISRREGILQ